MAKTWSSSGITNARHATFTASCKPSSAAANRRSQRASQVNSLSQLSRFALTELARSPTFSGLSTSWLLSLFPSQFGNFRPYMRKITLRAKGDSAKPNSRSSNVARRIPTTLRISRLWQRPMRRSLRTLDGLENGQAPQTSKS